MTRRVVVLGSTGSIGTQTLEVVSNLGYEVVGLAARTASAELADQARRFPDARVAVADAAADDRVHFTTSFGSRVGFGDDAVVEAAGLPGAIVVNGIVGAIGLKATLAALAAGNRVGLANKESLVAGGPVVNEALRAGDGELVPIDSEHSALLQCLVGEDMTQVERLVLTASGGPFRGWDAAALAAVTPEQALRHPTWDMGPRITVDSATLFNKGLEVIEAHHLFGIDYDRIAVVVHPQSILHSVVEFVDGSWKGHLGQADMRIPIQYALTAPERSPGPAARFDLAGRSLEFEEPDRDLFPALDIAFEAGRKGGSAPATLNAADEVAVAAFLDGRIGFSSIAHIVAETLAATEWTEISTYEDVLSVDREARSVAESMISNRARSGY